MTWKSVGCDAIQGLIAIPQTITLPAAAINKAMQIFTQTTLLSHQDFRKGLRTISTQVGDVRSQN